VLLDEMPRSGLRIPSSELYSNHRARRLRASTQTEVTPEQAEQIPAGAVEEIAAQAEKKDPSVIDQVSNFYAEHPTLVKTLGAAALTIALTKIAQRQQAG
jgi:hypothetical protein